MWEFSDEQAVDVEHSTLSEEEKAFIVRKMWTDDGRYICAQYHAVRAGTKHTSERITYHRLEKYTGCCMDET
eukprot:5972410-Pyramimonas_sp.AAC.1